MIGEEEILVTTLCINHFFCRKYISSFCFNCAFWKVWRGNYAVSYSNAESTWTIKEGKRGVSLVRLMDTQYVSGVTRTETRESTREILLRTGMHSFPIEMFARLSRPLASSDETLVAKIGFYFKNNKRSFLSCAEYTLNFVRVILKFFLVELIY